MKAQKSRFIIVAGLLLASILFFCGCAQEGPEVKAINDGILKFSKLNSGLVTVYTYMEPDNAALSDFKRHSRTELTFSMSRRGFDYLQTTFENDNFEQQICEKVISGEKTTFVTDGAGEVISKDDEPQKVEDNFERPASIRFMFEKLKASQVAKVEIIADPLNPKRIGYRICRDQKFLDKVNKGRAQVEGSSLMLDNSIVYWLNDDGILAELDYYSTEQVTQNGQDGIVKMTVVHRLDTYNDSALENVINKY